MADDVCLFCEIVAGRREAARVHEDAGTVAFLDHRPLFPGHVLLVPRAHHVLLGDLPSDQVEPLFRAARLLSRAVREALEAEGTFLAINNGVSQSVPHLHVHVVPRKKGDGLKGFFWPRRKYESDSHLEETRVRIRTAVKRLALAPTTE
jgi:histidine triad (HIT) family protein